MNNEEVISLIKIYIDDHFAGSQSQYAESMNVSPQFVSAVLRNKKSPSKQMMEHIGVEKIVTTSYKSK
ncbi:DNA-binding domain protein [Vibrio phage 1.076.O._10N.286.51.B7]|nr:DNA-binding domain protein [Vibrio phage 1.076.O._10N.286.51.B7]AUR95689.1 DNA-binding domain protein [Vibrio phage 1.210.O._10N.222.52.C2]